MSKMSIMEKLMSLSAEEAVKYQPRHEYIILSDVQECGVTIRNVPRVSFTAPTVEDSFIPPDVEEILTGFLHNLQMDVGIKQLKKNKPVFDYDEIKERTFVAH